MKVILVFVLVVSLSCFGGEYEELNSQIMVQLEVFKNQPTSEGFDKIKASAEQMIDARKLDPAGYDYLSSLYRYSLGTVLSKNVAERNIQRLKNELAVEVSKQLVLFKGSPTETSFKAIKSASEQIIKMDTVDPTGYLNLCSLYKYASGVLFDDVLSAKLSLDIVTNYQELEGRKGDLSKLQTILKQSYDRRMRAKKMNSDSEKHLEQMKQPAAVVRARKLVEKYRQDANRTGKYDQTLLDEALSILKKGIVTERANYKIYLQLFKVYQAKENYADAYVAWTLACHFGDLNDLALINASTVLYSEAMNYELSGNVSKDDPGSNSMLYFHWLNRELYAQMIPPEIKVQVDRVNKKAKEIKARAQKR